MIRIGLFLLFEMLVLLASRRIVKLLSGPSKLEDNHSAELCG